jgi:D-serine deaminase-like pyridoxal phosphate-dependent protein
MPVPTATDSKPDLYTAVDDIETPAIVVDLDVMKRNMEWYAGFAEEHAVSLRSHTKTHKIPEIAHWEHGRTSGGIVCQTLSEVEVMAQAGLDDIYLSYMVVGDSKLDRLVNVSQKLDAFATTVDGPGNINPLQAAAADHDTTVDAVLEIDIGLERVGVAPEDAPGMAQYLADQPNVNFAGVMAYEGHLGYGDKTEADYERECAAAMDEVEATVDRIEDAGVEVAEVKVGSTPTSLHSGKHPVVTEINPGMFPFMDARLIEVPHIEKEDCALGVLTTVISAPADDRVVVDAGSKSVSLETDYDPLVSDDAHAGARYYNASEEHGWIDVGDYAADFEVGDRLEFIPPHVCPTINLHDTLVGVRDGIVESVWSVQGRGKVK